MTAFLSGEMRDTVEIVSTEHCGTDGADDTSASGWFLGSGEGERDSNQATWRARAQLIDQFFSRKERAKLFRRWPGASSMWIKVGQHGLYPYF
jgi:hypothetical protein